MAIRVVRGTVGGLRRPSARSLVQDGVELQRRGWSRIRADSMRHPGLEEVVGPTGFEPATPCAQDGHSMSLILIDLCVFVRLAVATLAATVLRLAERRGFRR